MQRTLVFLALLSGAAVSLPAAVSAAPANELAQAQSHQQKRIQALSRRDRQGAYEALVATGDARPPAPLRDATGHVIGLSVEQRQAATREAAIDLAALGFTAADVSAYRKRDVDLFELVRKFFSGTASPGEQMAMADTVVIATAGPAVQGRTRLDGFLSAIPLTVVDSLKGSRAPGDTVYLARKSGLMPDGLLMEVSSEVALVPGKRYLLALSKNLYELWTAEARKQPEAAFSALPFLIYEVSDGGALLAGPQPARSGANPKDIKTAERQLRTFSLDQH